MSTYNRDPISRKLVAILRAHVAAGGLRATARRFGLSPTRVSRLVRNLTPARLDLAQLLGYNIVLRKRVRG